MDILERLAFGVTTVAVSPAYRAATGIHGAPRTVSHKARPRRS